MKIYKIYISIFYWLYEMGEHAPSKWASHWKAYTIMNVLEVWTLFSIFYYISGTYKININVSLIHVGLPIMIIFFVKTYYICELEIQKLDSI